MTGRLKTILVVILLGLGSLSLRADDERIILDAKINGQPVRFALDTGMGGAFLLFSPAAEKLNLKFSPPDPNARIGPGQFPVGWTDPQNVKIAGVSVNTRFGVAEMPGYYRAPFDGVIGWMAICNNVFFLDCATHAVGLFTNDEKKLDGWVQCRIQTNSDLTLALSGKGGQREIITLDSGSPSGVELNSEDWKDWEITHADRPMTMNAHYGPGSGPAVSKEGWADTISFGRLVLTDVPVRPADSGDIGLHATPPSHFLATLGFAALKRLDVVIDGPRGMAYLRPKKTPPLPYAYNHLAAVFVPRDLQSDDLVAHVIKDGPGYNAGIRDGDVLLKIGHLDCTLWRIDPNVLPLSRFFEAEEGTKLELTMKHGDKVFKTTAVLKNILPPDAPAAN